MFKPMFEPLDASDIEVRVGNINERGCSLLLYKNARCDMRILDETFGVFGWQRTHQLIGNNLYCTISIKDPETGEWIQKQDVGVESYTEKEKGQCSDALKRAGFVLGIGRELYTSPFIWVNPTGVNLKQDNGKYKTYDKFTVSHIAYNDGRKREISELVITNDTMKKEVFRMMPTPAAKKSTKSTVKDFSAYPDRATMMDLAKKKYPEGSDNLKKLLDGWKIENLDDANDAQLMVIWGRYGGKD